MSNPTELPDLDRNTIREVFLRNGFTIKEGQTDLKPYVYAAGAELIALARRAKPEDEYLEGRSVSVDVSTGEHDAGDRIFAELTGETGSDGTTLIAIEKSRNFGKPEGEAPQAVAYLDLGKLSAGGMAYATSFRTNDKQTALAKAAATLSPLCGAQHAESGKEGVIDYSIDKGDTVYHKTWRLTPLEVVDVNWALSAIALQLGSDGCVVVWPAAGLSKTPYDERAAQLDGGQEGSESNG